MVNDEQAIRALIARWHSATARGDVETVLGLMAEDVIFLMSGRPPMQGRSTFAKGLRTVLQSQRIESTGDIQELVISGELAYCVTLLNVRMISLDRKTTQLRCGSTLSIFCKQPDSSWLLTRDANLLTAPA